MNRITIAGRDCVLGCDVSKWQGGINYNVFNLDFIFAKATGGDNVLYTDSKWYNNAQGFLSAGIPLGAYHFAGRQNPVYEANYFLDRVLDSAWADAPAEMRLPLTCDAEWTNPRFGAGAADWAVRFAERVEDRVNEECWIYSAGWVGLEPDQRLLRYPFWLAAYVTNPDNFPCAPWGNNWSCWQFTSSGSVSGIQGGCDTNAMLTSVYARVTGKDISGPVQPQPIPTPRPPEYKHMLFIIYGGHVYGFHRTGPDEGKWIYESNDSEVTAQGNQVVAIPGPGTAHVDAMWEKYIRVGGPYDGKIGPV